MPKGRHDRGEPSSVPLLQNVRFPLEDGRLKQRKPPQIGNPLVKAFSGLPPVAQVGIVLAVVGMLGGSAAGIGIALSGGGDSSPPAPPPPPPLAPGQYFGPHVGVLEQYFDSPNLATFDATATNNVIAAISTAT